MHYNGENKLMCSFFFLFFFFLQTPVLLFVCSAVHSLLVVIKVVFIKDISISKGQKLHNNPSLFLLTQLFETQRVRFSAI